MNKRFKFFLILLTIASALLYTKAVFAFYDYKAIKQEQIKSEIYMQKKTVQNEIKEKNSKIINKQTNYQACLKEPIETTENLLKKENEITSYLKGYNLSVEYQNEYNYTYKYNSNIVYYAASTIKMLDAIYIYDKAIQGKINLDKKLTYTIENKRPNSFATNKYRIGDKITIRDLVKYAVTVSDNTAHFMLLNYIGFNTLKEYGNSLGAKQTLIGGDNFGNITTYDSIIYLKKLNEIINKGKLGKELQEYFVNSRNNFLNIDNIKSAQKYGEHDVYFHTNGIVYTTNKYYISILTKEGKNETLIKNINQKIYELHNLYYSEKKNVCHKKIYEDA